MKKLLVTTDFSELAQGAYAYAAALAKRHGAKLYLAHASGPGPTIYGIPLQERQLELAQQLREESQHPDFGGLDVEAQLIYGAAPRDRLLEFARRTGIDLIVMSTHGRSGLGHFFLGSFAESTVRHSAVPVLTCRAREGREQVFPGSVLVPFDFSDNAKAVFGTVELLNRLYRPKFTFLHVFPAADDYYYGRFPTKGLLEQWQRTAAREAQVRGEEFSILRKKHFPEAEATFETRIGIADREIVKRAEELDTDLVLLATHGRTGLAHVFLGSVAEKVVRRAPCSVWTVRPEGELAGAVENREVASGV